MDGAIRPGHGREMMATGATFRCGVRPAEARLGLSRQASRPVEVGYFTASIKDVMKPRSATP